VALANWTNAQVISQLDSGAHLTGLSWTYAFPTSNSWIPVFHSEKSGFAPLNVQQQQSATLAIQLWDDLIRPNITPTTGASHATITVSNVTNSDAYSYAYFPHQAGWEGSTAWINSNYQELTTPKTGDYSFLTYLHELGHTLGLDHMGNYNGTANWATDASSLQDSHLYSVMSYFTVSETGQAQWTSGWVQYFPQTPMLNDILAIQAIYGADPTTRATNTTYGFNASGISQNEAQIYDYSVNQHPIMTLYDAGGIDTLDLSGFSAAARIDLVAGHYSSAAGFTNNIGIATNTTIENAAGGSGNDTITGNAANNVLDGGAGNDIMAGGLGNDTYLVDASGDVVTEALNAGFDTVKATASHTLGLNVENLTLLGSAHVNGTGNALANALTGNNGDNVLDGGAGADILTGGLGNDTYVIDSSLDRIVETAGQGIDTVKAAYSIALGLNLENLTLTGSASLIGYGNATNNVITANAGSNRLAGLDGNDRLLGNGGNDQLYGGNGNDWLRGGMGSDYLSGGTGTDTFHFDSQTGYLTRDTITDFTATAGASHDIIELSTTLARGFDDLIAHHAFQQVGLNAVLTLAPNEVVTLLNVNIQSLTADDFAFV
jgi:serralysin